MLGGVDDEQRHALREYGFNLGVAFQLVDDLLDYTADLDTLGKPVGGDLREGKVTLPVILLLARDPERADALVRGIVAEGEVSRETWTELTGLLREHRAIDHAYDRAIEHATAAKRYLDVFPPSAERDALLALPDYVLARDR